MSTNTLPPVKAVRERTFATPGGRYTVRVWRPQIADLFGRWITTWEVLVKNPDRTQTVIARGEEAMYLTTLVSHVDAMLIALESAQANRFGAWAQSEDLRDRLGSLRLWAMHRRDVRSALRGAQRNIWGEWLGWALVRETRAAWAKYFGWELPDGYVNGDHLRKLDNNPTD